MRLQTFLKLAEHRTLVTQKPPSDLLTRKIYPALDLPAVAVLMEVVAMT